MFIGRHAKTFSSYKPIGFGQGDGLLRAELSDHKAGLLKPLIALTVPGKQNFKMSDLLDHPELYAAYPELRETKVRTFCAPGIGRGSCFSAYSGTITMEYDPSLIDSDIFLKSLAHEAQHNIQLIENFHGGAHHNDFFDESLTSATRRLEQRFSRTKNPDLQSKRYDLLNASMNFERGYLLCDNPNAQVAMNQLLRRSERRYRRSPGELEAYETEGRLALTPEQRESSLPQHVQTAAMDAVAHPRLSDIYAQRTRNKLLAMRNKTERPSGLAFAFSQLFAKFSAREIARAAPTEPTIPSLKPTL